MQRYTRFLVWMNLLGFCLLLSCNRKANKGITITPDAIPPINIDTNVEIQIPDIEEVKIEIKQLLYYGKTACYGDCPIFFLKVFSDGKIEYNGIKNVARKGMIEGQVSKEKLRHLMQTIEAKGFFQLAEKYPLTGNRIADFPNTILEVNNNTISHKVVNNYDAPANFFEVEALVKEIMLIFE